MLVVDVCVCVGGVFFPRVARSHASYTLTRLHTADVTEEVIAALDEDLDRPQERTVHDAERASSRLLSAARIYTVDPSNLARQDELIQARWCFACCC